MHVIIGVIILMWLLGDDKGRGCIFPILIGIALGPVIWAVIKFIFMIIVCLIVWVFSSH